ncbi:LysM peptidoglycan-binding domain-containing protein [Cryobacterium soli]|uniref:LysM peptidoglycan-binding domain-containing protein n=1 Tax=Cryobacterium soli TaxID=2220095 RepID=UPI000E72FE6A|nr:LysM peptidoglycan-binding domain-containing protein [Cryobacterium soli]
MSAAYALKPGSGTGGSNTSRPNAPRLSIVGDSRENATQVASAPRTHLRLTRRGRIVFTTLAALPLVLGSIVVAVNGGVAAAEGTTGVGAAAFDYVTIESGQSLWQLAESIAPTQDPRDVIADIVNLNQLASDAVQPGQRLALPAGY